MHLSSSGRIKQKACQPAASTLPSTHLFLWFICYCFLLPKTTRFNKWMVWQVSFWGWNVHFSWLCCREPDKRVRWDFNTKHFSWHFPWRMIFKAWMLEVKNILLTKNGLTWCTMETTVRWASTTWKTVYCSFSLNYEFYFFQHPRSWKLLFSNANN